MRSCTAARTAGALLKSAGLWDFACVPCGLWSSSICLRLHGLALGSSGTAAHWSDSHTSNYWLVSPRFARRQALMKHACKSRPGVFMCKGAKGFECVSDWFAKTSGWSQFVTLSPIKSAESCSVILITDGLHAKRGHCGLHCGRTCCVCIHLQNPHQDKADALRDPSLHKVFDIEMSKRVGTPASALPKFIPSLKRVETSHPNKWCKRQDVGREGH